MEPLYILGIINETFRKMIKIEFFDHNGRQLTEHLIEMVPMRKFPFFWVKVYCKAIFTYYEYVSFASVTIDGRTQIFDRCD